MGVRRQPVLRAGSLAGGSNLSHIIANLRMQLDATKLEIDKLRYIVDILECCEARSKRVLR